MSVLNQKEIIKELEQGVNSKDNQKGILIHPLEKGSIRSCNLCLTASKYAYSIGEEKQLTTYKDVKEKEYLHIPPKDTVLIWTNESIFLSKFFCASLHSPTSLVSQGIGHLGTRINPNWYGILCIPIHNLSKKPIKIYIQDIKNPIAYLMIHKLVGKSSEDGNIDGGSRLDIINGLHNKEEICEYYHSRENIWMSSNIKSLQAKISENNEYIRITDNFWKRLRKDISSDVKIIIFVLTGFISLLTGSLTNNGNDSIKKIANNFAEFLVFIFLVILTIVLFSLIEKYQKQPSKEND